ncbi:MAG TPA: hypothetical protein VF867_04250, partial [Arthrobacter sp.]
AGASFDEAYEEFFKPLEDYEAAHGPWQNTRPPSEEKLRDLAGLTGVNLGRTAGFSVEADETTGDPVIAVTTRNGNSHNRACAASGDGDCGTCNDCIQENVIPALPTHIRDDDDFEDPSYVTSYFRPLDPVAANRYLADQKTREILNQRTWTREAITSGKQPPWAILSPVRDGAERKELDYTARKARTSMNQNRADERYARELLAAVDAGAPLPVVQRAHGALMDAAGYRIYGDGLKEHAAAAAKLRAQAATLDAERGAPLPPAIAALAAAESAHLAEEADKEDQRAAHSRERLGRATDSVRGWADRRLEHAASLTEALTKAEAAMSAFAWSVSWPGDPADCPPKPAAE